MSIKDAFLGAIDPVEELYFDTFTMYGFKEIKLANGSLQNTPNHLLLSDIPCRVYQRARAGTTAVSDGQAPAISYELRLMCNPKYDVLAGSRYVVTDVHGNVREYERADEGFISYISHQEITLIRQRDVTETVPLEEGG